MFDLVVLKEKSGICWRWRCSFRRFRFPSRRPASGPSARGPWTARSRRRHGSRKSLLRTVIYDRGHLRGQPNPGVLPASISIRNWRCSSIQVRGSPARARGRGLAAGRSVQNEWFGPGVPRPCIPSSGISSPARSSRSAADNPRWWRISPSRTSKRRTPIPVPADLLRARNP